EGAQKEKIVDLIGNLSLKKNIKLLGFKDRDDVIELMSRTKIFIMISNNETFGLVYLEAMARGCIVIASKDSGIDGIIKHRNNGFLCEQGNEKELVEIINAINNMSFKELENISANAKETAAEFTDSKVAESYLKHIMVGN